MPRRRVLVHGRVQGVAFRAYARRVAQQLGVCGWIRNRADGRRVELVVEAENDPLATFLDWCGRGPTHARVERVEVHDEPDDEPLSAFDVRPTA